MEVLLDSSELSQSNNGRCRLKLESLGLDPDGDLQLDCLRAVLLCKAMCSDHQEGDQHQEGDGKAGRVHGVTVTESQKAPLRSQYA